MANNQNNTANEKNYVGSSFLSHYKEEFNGFVTYFTRNDLQELEKFMNEDGRVGVRVQFAKNPEKAYATMFKPNPRPVEGSSTQAAHNSKQGPESDDLPF